MGEDRVGLGPSRVTPVLPRGEKDKPAPQALKCKFLLRAGHRMKNYYYLPILAPAVVAVCILLFRTSPPEPGSRFVEGIPLRRADAPTGSEFVEQTKNTLGGEREVAIWRQLSDGNIPDFMRELKPVVITSRGRWRRPMSATIWVTPDYLSVGTDDDFVRTPMGLPTACAVAVRFDCVLPTRKMVDAIYRESAVHLKPQPMRPGPEMCSTLYFWNHNRLIESQRDGHPAGELVSGHKKDLVLTKRLRRKPGRVAIYGWHRRNRRPIQSLSTVHGARYADYSHGVRLVSTTVLVDGIPMSIFDVLEDPKLAGLLSDEGVIRARELLSLQADAAPLDTPLASQRLAATEP